MPTTINKTGIAAGKKKVKHIMFVSPSVLGLQVLSEQNL